MFHVPSFCWVLCAFGAYFSFLCKHISVKVQSGSLSLCTCPLSHNWLGPSFLLSVHQFHPVTCWLLTLKGFSLLAFSSHQPNKSTSHSTSLSLFPDQGVLNIIPEVKSCDYESSFPFTTISDKAPGQLFYMGSIWYVASSEHSYCWG